MAAGCSSRQPAKDQRRPFGSDAESLKIAGRRVINLFLFLVRGLDKIEAVLRVTFGQLAPVITASGLACRVIS
jgi:hypothetical protein